MPCNSLSPGVAIRGICNQQRTPSLSKIILFANTSAFRSLPGKYCSPDSRCPVTKGGGNRNVKCVPNESQNFEIYEA